jgi:uncharacterized membrane protein HdeD (DUF308 family)
MAVPAHLGEALMSDDGTGVSVSASARFDLAQYWGVVLAYGLACIGLGVVLAVWPDETLVVVAVLVAIQILLSGVLRIVTALTADALDRGVRLLIGLTGGLALVVGLLCLRDPVQTILIVTLLLGVWWVASGVVDVIAAVVSPMPGRRTWDILSGVITFLAGGVLLVNPELSLGVLVVVICVMLFCVGGASVVAALALRSAGDSRSQTASTPPAAPSV